MLRTGQPTAGVVCAVAYRLENANYVVRHAKCVTFQMAEVSVPRELFVAIVDRVQRFGVPPPLVQPG